MQFSHWKSSGFYTGLICLILLSASLVHANPVKITGEWQVRFESRNNFDLRNATDDDDGFSLNRIRLNFDWVANERTRLFLQLQDSRIGSSEFANPTPYRDNLDVRQFYIDHKLDQKSLWTLRFGRQELAYGKQRLIGGFNWSNVAQSFDGVKIGFRKNPWEVDLFAVRPVMINRTRFNGPDSQTDFYGIYAAWLGLKNHRLEVYGLRRNSNRPVTFGPTAGGAATMQETTLGFRVEGTQKRWDYELEMAHQSGSSGAQTIDASALAAVVGYTFDAPSALRLSLEYDIATGDGSATDGKRKTFDNLYPTNHIHYGFGDRMSWQNMRDLKVGIGGKFARRWHAQLDVHKLRLHTINDSLYHAGRGLLVAAAAPGTTSDDVGTELDLLFKFNQDARRTWLLGFSRLSPGNYLKQNGRPDDLDFVYVQFKQKF